MQFNEYLYEIYEEFGKSFVDRLQEYCPEDLLYAFRRDILITNVCEFWYEVNPGGYFSMRNNSIYINTDDSLDNNLTSLVVFKHEITHAKQEDIHKFLDNEIEAFTEQSKFIERLPEAVIKSLADQDAEIYSLYKNKKITGIETMVYDVDKCNILTGTGENIAEYYKRYYGL